MLEDAEPDILAFYAFQAAHGRRLRSTNPREHFNKEIGRRTAVVGSFPDDRSLIRLAGMLCIEHKRRMVGRPAAIPRPSRSPCGSQAGRSHGQGQCAMLRPRVRPSTGR